MMGKIAEQKMAVLLVMIALKNPLMLLYHQNPEILCFQSDRRDYYSIKQECTVVHRICADVETPLRSIP